MRHRVKTKKLNRDKDHRKALRYSLAKAILEHPKITTTKEKAKFVKPFVERLVTKARKNDLSTRRLLLKRLRNNKKLVEILLKDKGPYYKKRPGGYLSIRSLGKRRVGDNAPLVALSWVEEKVEVKTTKKVSKSKGKAVKSAEKKS